MSGKTDQGQCPWLEANALSGHFDLTCAIISRFSRLKNISEEMQLARRVQIILPYPPGTSRSVSQVTRHWHAGLGSDVPIRNLAWLGI